MDNPGNPLREFKGNLKEYRTEAYTPNPSDNNPNPKARVRVEFDFTEVEPIRTEEPYPYPVTTISVGYADPKASNSETNRWAHLSKSVRRVTEGHCPPGEVLDFITGKTQVWEMSILPVRMPDDDGNWADQQVEVWTLKSIEGYELAGNDGEMDIMSYLGNLIDGKNEATFNAAVFADPKIKSHPKIIEQATDRSLIPAIEAGGGITRDDDGVYHKS